MINGIDLVISALQIIASRVVITTLFLSDNIIGVTFPSTSALYKFNSMFELTRNIKNNNNNENIGFLKKGYIKTAEFFGFDKKDGKIAYNLIDLTLSGYGLLRLTKKPEKWWLFRYINSDFTRKISTMSKADLALEAAGDGLTLKALYDSYNK